MSNNRIQLLNKQQTQQKIKRIAFEILENNFNEKELVLIGVEGMGYIFAQLLRAELNEISKLKLSIIKIFLDKNAPLQSDIKLEADINLKNKVVILVDDVLNTGRTLVYSLKPFLNTQVKKIQTAVIVDRDFKSFPVSADYVGYSLSTSLKDHVSVILDNKDSFGVYVQ